MMQFNEQQRRFLQDLGRTDNGTQLVQILREMDRHYSSITTIDKTRPTDAQIEGRALFSEVVNELIQTIEKQKHRPVAVAHDDYT